MRNRNAIVILVLLAAAAWWYLHEDPEAAVRDAHQELASLLSNPEGDINTTTIINARILRSLFADTCEVTGDAESFAGSYTPEEMISMIIRVQGVFLRVELTFHELVIEFPAADEAIAEFTAVLLGTVKMEGEEEVGETRNVVSRMRKIEGKWLFAGFKLARLPDTK